MANRSTHSSQAGESGESAPISSIGKAPGKRSRYKWLAFGVLLFAVIVRVWLLMRPLPALDGRTIPDDTYISLEIAKQIGQGNGPVFIDRYTNGFQPLYVWFTSGVFAFLDPESLLETETLDAMVSVALAFCALFDLLSILLIMHIIRLAFRRADGFTRDATALIAGFMWALHPATLRAATNGLETSLAVLLLLGAWRLSLTCSFRDTKARHFLLLGLVVGIGGMARIDVLVLGVYFALASVWALVSMWRAEGPSVIKAWFLRNLALLVGTIAGYAPWFFYSLYYTGEWFPISGKAVRWISLTNANFNITPAFYWSKFRVGYRAIASNSGYLFFVVGTFLAIVVGLWIGSKFLPRVRDSKALKQLRDTPFAWLALPIIHGICLFLAYTCYIFAPWFFKRYLYVINPLVISVSAVALGAGVAWGAKIWPRRFVRPLLCIAVAVYVGVVCLRSRRFQIIMFWPASEDTGYRNLGIWADTYFPRGTKVGSSQTGALAYYSRNIHYVNLDGVVNSEAIREIMAGRNMEYIRNEGIDYVVGWRTNTTYIKRNTKEWSEDQLVEIGQVSGFRSWHSTWRLYEVIYPVGHPKRNKPIKLLPPGLGVEASDHSAAAEAAAKAAAERRRKRAQQRNKPKTRPKAPPKKRPQQPAAPDVGSVRIPSAGPIRLPGDKKTSASASKTKAGGSTKKPATSNKAEPDTTAGTTASPLD